LKGWKGLIQLKELNGYLSSKFRENSLVTRAFRNFSKAYAIARCQRENDEQLKVDNFRAFMFKRKVITAIKNYVFKELLVVKELRHKIRTKAVFLAWKGAMKGVIRENLEWERQIQMVIDRFRVRIIAPKIIEAWKFYVDRQRIEKEKQKFKKDIWHKVNGWLDEIDEQRDKEEL
jgi:hypothetical protein